MTEPTSFSEGYEVIEQPDLMIVDEPRFDRVVELIFGAFGLILFGSLFIYLVFSEITAPGGVARIMMAELPDFLNVNPNGPMIGPLAITITGLSFAFSFLTALFSGWLAYLRMVHGRVRWTLDKKLNLLSWNGKPVRKLSEIPSVSMSAKGRGYLVECSRPTRASFLARLTPWYCKDMFFFRKQEAASEFAAQIAKFLDISVKNVHPSMVPELTKVTESVMLKHKPDP